MNVRIRGMLVAGLVAAMAQDALAALQPSVTSLSYTTALGASSAAQTVTYTNMGGGPQNVTAISLAGSNAADFSFAVALQPPFTIGPGASFPVDVTFTPTAKGKRVAVLSVTVAGMAGTIDVSLTGL